MYIGKILSSHQKIIKKSPQLRKIFKDQPLCSFRRDKNLADIMVHQKTAKGELYPFFYSCVSFCILKFPFDRAHPLLTVVRKIVCPEETIC
jgi:hypothetical protein